MYQEFLEQKMALPTQQVELDFTNRNIFMDSKVQELQLLKLQIIKVCHFCIFFSLLFSYMISC